MHNLKFLFFFIILMFLIVIEFILFVEENQAKVLALSFFTFNFIVLFYMFSKIRFPMILEFIGFGNLDFKIFNFYNLTAVYSIDFVSIMFLLLVSFIFVIVMLTVWNIQKLDVKALCLLLISLQFFLFNAFTCFDVLFFYFWSESSLIPIFFIILIWGKNKRKIVAAFYLFMYTTIFSILFLLSIIILHLKVKTTSVYLINYYTVFSLSYQFFFFLSFIMAFLVKLPIFPIHLWLPEAHVEAPTFGSVLLASLLLKLGYYGIFRFLLQLAPLSIVYLKSIFAVIGVLSCTYTALISLSQFDFKKIIAYSSVSHMSLILVGVFTENFYGVLGSFILAIGHTFVAAALFMLVGFIYDRYHTRTINYFSGLAELLPKCSTLFFLFSISNFGFPLSLNFIGEFTIFLGIGKWNFFILLSLLLYSVVSVAYNLFLYIRVFHGSKKSIEIYDLSKIELFTVFPVALANFWFFIKANSIIKYLLPLILSFLAYSNEDLSGTSFTYILSSFIVIPKETKVYKIFFNFFSKVYLKCLCFTLNSPLKTYILLYFILYFFYFLIALIYNYNLKASYVFAEGVTPEPDIFVNKKLTIYERLSVWWTVSSDPLIYMKVSDHFKLLFTGEVLHVYFPKIPLVDSELTIKLAEISRKSENLQFKINLQDPAHFEVFLSREINSTFVKHIDLHTLGKSSSIERWSTSAATMRLWDVKEITKFAEWSNYSFHKATLDVYFKNYEEFVNFNSVRKNNVIWVFINDIVKEPEGLQKPVKTSFIKKLWNWITFKK